MAGNCKRDLHWKHHASNITEYSQKKTKSMSANDINCVKSKVLNERKISRNVMKEPTKFSISNLRSVGPYKLTKTIGTGSTSKVRLGIHETSHSEKAIKIIPRRGYEVQRNAKESVQAREARIYREAALLSLLHHPNIVGMSEMITTPDMFFLFFEYVEGQQLLEYVIANGALKESAARKIVRQLLSAVSYCHQNSVVHRDLKIENVMIDKEGNAKLIDFGLSNFFDPKALLKTFCGSLYFAAPELLSGKAYTGPEVDVWSLGVIIYVLLVGQVPFDDKNIHSLHDKIKAAQFELPSFLSQEAQDLISNMIVASPSKRFTLDEVKNHPWVTKGYEEAVNDFIPERLPFDKVDEAVAEFLNREFSCQFRDIDVILQTATKDWCKVQGNPVISLYFLVKEKLARQKTRQVEEPQQYPVSLPTPLPEIHKKMEQTENCSIPSVDKSKKEKRCDRVGSFDVKDSALIRYFNEKIHGESVGIGVRKVSSPDYIASPSAASDSKNVIHMKVKPIFLRGLFSFHPTHYKTTDELARALQARLNSNQIEYKIEGGIFYCQTYHHQRAFEEDYSSLRDFLAFEIIATKSVIGNILGVHLKRTIGDPKIFKEISSRILSSI